MNQSGRQMLYRINMRCAVEWGAALARMEQSPRPGLCLEPFEATAWHDAIYIVDSLYNGWPVDERMKNEKSV